MSSTRASSFRDALGLAGLLLWPSKTRASRVYELLASRSHLGGSRMYLNLGYWEGTRDYDEACEALARLLAESAGLKPGDSVLDVGFGFADQDLYWTEAFQPRLIVGLNITRSQVEEARRRVAERGLEDHIQLQLGSATRMPVKDGSFDRVLALETAFHYDTREDFFREAFRALKPGGRLATADILPLARPGWNLLHRLYDYGARSFWQVPACNMYPAEVYCAKLKAAGFKNVSCRSIREQVYPQFLNYAKSRLDEPEIKSRIHPLIRLLWKSGVQDPSKYGGLDYVIVTADKPG